VNWSIDSLFSYSFKPAFNCFFGGDHADLLCFVVQSSDQIVQ
jgi:hypothetical protein